MVFYRTMHYSAKCSIAIACRPSVRLSVTLVDQDHIGWKILETNRTDNSLFAAQRPSTYSQGIWVNLGENRGGVAKKWRAGTQKRQCL